MEEGLWVPKTPSKSIPARWGPVSVDSIDAAQALKERTLDDFDLNKSPSELGFGDSSNGDCVDVLAGKQGRENHDQAYIDSGNLKEINGAEGHVGGVAESSALTSCEISSGGVDGCGTILPCLDKIGFTEVVSLLVETPPAFETYATPRGGVGKMPGGGVCPASHSKNDSSINTPHATLSVPEVGNCVKPKDNTDIYGYHGLNQGNHEDDVLFAINEDSNEKSQSSVRSASAGFSTPSKKDNARRRNKDDVNLNMHSRTKKKRYWPKVVVEGKLKKTPKPSTPKLRTPKPPKHAACKKSSDEKRKYAGKNSHKGSTKPSKDLGVDSQTYDASTECVLESSTQALGFTFSLENHESEYVQNNSFKASARRALNFNYCQKDTGIIIHQYQRRKKKMDSSSHDTNSIVQQSKESNESMVENSADMAFGYTQSEKWIKSTYMAERKAANDATNQTGCCYNSLKVYQRSFRVNQCLSNSRKLGPNFPKICKKRRMRRRKATILLSFMASEDGMGRENTTMYCPLRSIIAAEESQRILKKRRMRRQKATKYGAWWSVGAAENEQKRVKTNNFPLRTIDRQLAPQFSAKNLPVGITSFDKNFLFAIFNCNCLVPNPLGKMISPAKTQRWAAVEDPDSFKCVLSLTPLATTKKKRSNDSTRRLNLGTLTFIPSCNQLPSALHTPAFNGRVRNQERLLTDKGNMVTKRQFKKGLFLDNAVYDHNKMEGCPKDVLPTLESLQDEFSVAFTDVIERLGGLHLSDEHGQLIVRNQNAYGTGGEHRAVILYKPKKQKPPPKVDIDQETMRIWKLLMGDGGEGVEEERDKDKEKWWEEQREVFRGRVDSFIARMHLIQGDRRFLPWKGSVVDSVVGVFLTQNVSDHLSSSAFMSLAAKYPFRPTTNHKASDEDEEIACSQESVGINIGAVEQTFDANKVDSLEILAEFTNTKTKDVGDIREIIGCVESSGSETIVQQKATPGAQEATVDQCASSKCQVLPECSSQTEVNQAKGRLSSKNHHGGSKIILQTETPLKKKKSKIEEKQDNPINWDDLRKTYVGSRATETTTDAMDSLDWEEVRQATVEEVADAIKGRGQHRVLAERIKDFLNRVVRDHGSSNLEWLRYVPPDKAKDYLLSFKGLGLKSVECIRLLTLHHHAFPVDVNVGRVAVRLGWVPLQPLPESLQIHLLEQYPLLDTIQVYLWPRLCTLDQRTLYELHYQMITFGKVFCRKRKPNCYACPMRGECRHFASAFASARLALPGPQEKSMVSSMVPDANVQNPALVITPVTKSLPEAPFSESRYQTKNCKPIIEHPPSPEPDSTENLERDIEDFFYESEDDIPTIRLDTEELKEKLREFIYKSNIPLEEGDMSKALVTLTAEAASIPMPKLKHVSRLRTVHHVYEIPDSHRILEGLEKRESDDPSPYLLAIWNSGETSSSSKSPRKQCDSWGSELCKEDTCSSCNNSQHLETVSGTILIPCRTATRGSFPLNGTYFQVNEVFADDESSQHPLQVPRSWIWNMRRRTLYCGAYASAIFRGLSTLEIQNCFWRGFVCVRAFNRKTRAPVHLSQIFHISTAIPKGKRKFTQDK